MSLEKNKKRVDDDVLQNMSGGQNRRKPTDVKPKPESHTPARSEHVSLSLRCGRKRGDGDVQSMEMMISENDRERSRDTTGARSGPCRRSRAAWTRHRLSSFPDSWRDVHAARSGGRKERLRGRACRTWTRKLRDASLWLAEIGPSLGRGGAPWPARLTRA
jgi:hypothetical protein